MAQDFLESFEDGTQNGTLHPAGLVDRHPLLAAWRGHGDDYGGHPRRLAQTSRAVHVHDGMIIHGWGKAVRLARAGRPLRYISIGAADPLAFVLERRRWMPASGDKAEAVAACCLWLPPGRPRRMRARFAEGANHSLMTAEDIAGEAGVSVRTVVRRKEALRVRMEREERPTDLDAALERIADLEARLINYQMAFQAQVDLGLTPDRAHEALRAAQNRNRVLRDRVRSAENGRRYAERDLKILTRKIEGLDLNVERKRVKGTGKPW